MESRVVPVLVGLGRTVLVHTWYYFLHLVLLRRYVRFDEILLFYFETIPENSISNLYYSINHSLYLLLYFFADINFRIEALFHYLLHVYAQFMRNWKQK